MAFESPPVHHAGAILGLIVSGWLIGGGLVRGAFGSALDRQAVDVSNVASWSIWGLLVLLSLGSLWDRAARHALPGLYACAWLAAALVLNQCEVGPRDLIFGIGLSGGLIVLLSGLLWTGRDAATRAGGRWGWPEPEALLARTAEWLPAVNVVVAVLVVMLEFWVVLKLEKLSMRLWGAAACAMLAAGVAAFAQHERRARFQELALLLAAVAAVDFGWAITEPQAEAQFALQRTIRLLVMLAATTFVYGGLLVRLVSVASGWFQAVRRVACLTGVLSVGALLAVIGMEATWFDPLHGAPVTPLQIGVVALVLVGLAAALVSLAVLPGRDPLDLSLAGRMQYVYASEGILALLFVHIDLTKPEWFQGYLLAYWPVIVMGLAFFGVGVGELFQRARQVVLAEPLQRTGAFLPLLPALGFWVHTSRAEYSVVLFAVGFLYVLLSMWRGSFVYSVAAALAGNAGLWALWHEQGAALLEHPQLWMIPPALSVLVAAQLNRDRLTAAQLTAVRYLSVTIIYVSSTGEMFITGVGESLWMPVILASLSVLGAFAGIALRVRAFLYLGSSFLMLSIVSMVWHAARNIGHVWPWWAFGIGLGLAILAVFGLFEKKHREMLELLDRLRQWEQ